MRTYRTILKNRLLTLSALVACGILAAGRVTLGQAAQETSEPAAVPLDISGASMFPNDRPSRQAVYSRYDGQRVMVEGIYDSGFETSKLGDLWVDVSPNVVKSGPEPTPDSWDFSQTPVRVFGTLHCQPGQGYGHVAMYHAELTADRVEFLDLPRAVQDEDDVAD